MSRCLVTLPWTTRHMPVLRAWKTVRVPAPVRTAQMPVALNLYLPLSPLRGQSLASMPWLSSCGSLTWPSCLSLLQLYWELGVTGKIGVTDFHTYSARSRSVVPANPHPLWKSTVVLMLAFGVNIELACVLLCAYRKRTIMSEYGPILDSNNPLSLNGDNPDQGIVMYDNRSNCLLSVICLSCQ